MKNTWKEEVIDMKKRLRERMLILIPLVLAIFVLMIGIRQKEALGEKGIEKTEKAIPIEGAWKICCDGKKIFHELPFSFENKECKPVTIEKKINRGSEPGNLAFYLTQSEVRVWMNDELIYEFMIPKTIGKSAYCPSRYHIINLLPNKNPAVIKIKIYPTYPLTAGNVPQVYQGIKYEMILEIIENNILTLFGSGVMIVLAVYVLVYSFVSEKLRRNIKKRLNTLAILLVFIGIWGILETPIKQFLFREYILVGYVLEIVFYAIPLCISRFFMTYEDIRKDRWNRIVSYFAYLQFCVVQIAVINGIPYIYLNGVMQISTGLVLICATWKAFRVNDNSELKTILKPMSVLCIGFLMELLRFVLVNKRGSGVFVIYAVIIFVSYYMFLTIRKESKDYIRLMNENSIVTEALEQTKVDLMLSQIKPHFLYNTLTSIQTILKVNPNYADELLFDFTRYLRGTIDSISADTLIMFREEIKNIEAYLHIEKMRLGEILCVEYDIRVTDFWLPPLSIQPIVENAVKHGIGKDTESLLVKISSSETEKQIYITVADNGIGFDEEKLKEKAHSVGYSNVEYRLRKQLDAAVDIKSTLGKGTKVTVSITK